MNLTIVDLRAAIHRLQAHLTVHGAALSELDGHLGDGDLGITLTKAFNRLAEATAELPDDLGKALGTCASLISKVSSSSFGTLMTVGCLAASKRVAGKTSVAQAEIPDLLADALDMMRRRGKAELGQKTVLDAMAAAIAAGRDAKAGTMPVAMLTAVRGTLDAFRDKPAQVGRARIFAERSVGMDDPGMKAFEAMLSALVVVSPAESPSATTSAR